MKAHGLVKLIEECGELQQIAAKKIEYFEVDEHPDGKGSMKSRLEDEIADVTAAIVFCVGNFKLDKQKIEARVSKKLEAYKYWRDVTPPAQSGHSFCAGVVVTEYAHPKMEHDFDDAVPHNLDSSHYWMDRYKAAEETIVAYEKSRPEIPVPSLEFWLERKGATRHGAETWLISNDGIKKIYGELCAMWEINQGFVNALQGDKLTEDKK